jgi:hypothetical protein
MGNHSSNLFCPGKDQPVAEPLLDPPGLGVCAPTVPSGMPQLVFDVASQQWVADSSPGPAGSDQVISQEARSNNILNVP